MKTMKASQAALAAALLAGAAFSQAATFTEIGDAGSGKLTANVIPGGTTFNTISGTLLEGDKDYFEFTIPTYAANLFIEAGTPNIANNNSYDNFGLTLFRPSGATSGTNDCWYIRCSIRLEGGFDAGKYYVAIVDTNQFSGTLPLGDYTVAFSYDVTTSAVPVPAAVWLFGSALLGLGTLKRKKA